MPAQTTNPHKPNQEVEHFIRLVQERVHANEHKGDGTHLTFNNIITNLETKIREISTAKSATEAIEKYADVAAYAMFGSINAARQPERFNPRWTK